MSLDDYPDTLARLKPIAEARDWTESAVPLGRRGVSLKWLVSFVNDLQAESQSPRLRALQEAERAVYHNKAADWGMHDQSYLPVPCVPDPTLMNVHIFVDQFVKPLTAKIKAPLYALVPSEHVGPPDTFISHAWNALMVGPEDQRIGMIDALAKPLSVSMPAYVWIDCVCYNQHLFETIAPDMERVIGEIGRIGFVATPVPLLDRSWCLWELLCCERTGASPCVFVRAGYRNDKILSVNAFFRSFVGVQSSKTSSNRDQKDILEGFLRQFGTFECADARIEELMREKLSASWFELHERDEDLQFRPYPWSYDSGTDAAGRAAGIKSWTAFDPHYVPALRESVLLGTETPILGMLIDAGMRASEADRTKREMEKASPTVLSAFQAAASGNTAALRRLLTTGVDPATRVRGMDLLTIAAGSGQVEAVRILLDAGADPDSAGVKISPLRIAADKGHAEVVRLLVERGAAVDAQAPDGWTALLWAGASGHLEIVKYLVEHGAAADIVASEKQVTPLFMASAGGHVGVVEYLLQMGAAVGPRAFNGSTPLHYAVHNGHAEVARLLLDHGADIRATNKKGVAVIALARSSGMPEDIIKRLTLLD
jgi:hypothetical protein